MLKLHVSDIFMLENLFCLVINEFFYLCNQYTYINIIFRGHGGGQTHLPGFCRSGPNSFRHMPNYNILFQYRLVPNRSANGP